MLKKIKKIPFKDRVAYCLNPTGRRLYEIISSKQTNLCLSVDVTNSKLLLNMADQVGTEICLLKTHIDILSDFNTDFIIQLKALAKKHSFLLFEDRKFADIGNTVKQQYAGGLYRIAEWADISNAHTVPGPGIIQALQTVGLEKQRGLLLLAEMSSIGSLAQGGYTQASINMAKDYPEFVIGFIAQRQLTENPGLVHMTPGVHWRNAGDQLGQHYISLEQAIIKNRTDIIIVGRGIYQEKDPLAAATLYRKSAWEAYLSCC
jgi:uridine monophosphate synthetase